MLIATLLLHAAAGSVNATGGTNANASTVIPLVVASSAAANVVAPVSWAALACCLVCCCIMCLRKPAQNANGGNDTWANLGSTGGQGLTAALLEAGYGASPGTSDVEETDIDALEAMLVAVEQTEADEGGDAGAGGDGGGGAESLPLARARRGSAQGRERRQALVRNCVCRSTGASCCILLGPVYLGLSAACLHHDELAGMCGSGGRGAAGTMLACGIIFSTCFYCYASALFRTMRQERETARRKAAEPPRWICRECLYSLNQDAASLCVLCGAERPVRRDKEGAGAGAGADESKTAAVAAAVSAAPSTPVPRRPSQNAAPAHGSTGLSAADRARSFRLRHGEGGGGGGGGGSSRQGRRRTGWLRRTKSMALQLVESGGVQHWSWTPSGSLTPREGGGGVSPRGASSAEVGPTQQQPQQQQVVSVDPRAAAASKAARLLEADIAWVRDVQRDGSLQWRTAADGYDIRPVDLGVKIDHRALLRVAALPFGLKYRWFYANIDKRTLEGSTLQLRVRRQHILLDSFQQLTSCAASDLRRRLAIQFLGERAIDAGGPLREWFELVATDLFQRDTQLFEFHATDNITYDIATEPAHAPEQKEAKEGEGDDAAGAADGKGGGDVDSSAGAATADGDTDAGADAGADAGGAAAAEAGVAAAVASPTSSVIVSPQVRQVMEVATCSETQARALLAANHGDVQRAINYFLERGIEGVAGESTGADAGASSGGTVRRRVGSTVLSGPLAGIGSNECYRFAGRFLGKAVLERQVLPMHLTRPLLKHLLGVPVTLNDVQFLDPEVYSSFTSILRGDVKVEDAVLDFTWTRRGEVIELKPGGEDIDVEYISLALRYLLLERVRVPLTELLRGFYEVVPQPLLSVFDFQELELLLCGLPTIDVGDWEANTDYNPASARTSTTIRWFWEVVREFKPEEHARLLQFVTGTAGVPIGGMSQLQGHFGKKRKFEIKLTKSGRLPEAHTCFNQLVLPAYESKEELSRCLHLVIMMEVTGFSMA